ncbi:M20 family metallopeptidase [Streptacidiphilus sp. N1-10]|uniref:M20 family metallopeptidase n=1 Tax=Streptacidiphilus jeojiensis TaxID=3229225 RepID=A0ABV6XGE7_9ACTN
MDVRDDAQAMLPELLALRRAVHREPEVGLALPRTQEKVLAALSGLPLAVTPGSALSSVTAVLRGAHPGPVVLLRADLDALPVDEEVDLPFRSRFEGRMHACGHDLHTAMLVGAAHLLAARRDRLAGSVVFMFQPGEEGYDGARHMIEEGVLDAADQRPAAAYALHVSSSLWEAGRFATRAGCLMAACDRLAVTVHGAGGHGSAPHRARNPIPVACTMVNALQGFLTGAVDPVRAAVISVGSIHAGTGAAIIPPTAHFEATVRTFDTETREAIARGAVRLCEDIARAHGMTAQAVLHSQYPATVAAERESAFAADVARDLFGADRFQEMAHPLTASEDFSRVLDVVPGTILQLGAALPGRDWRTAPANHSPLAAFDDSLLPDGAALYAELALRRLARGPAD